MDRHVKKSTTYVEYVYDEASSLYCRLDSTDQYSVILAGEVHAAALCAALPAPCIVVRNRAELIAETSRPGAIAFVDCDLLSQVYNVVTAPIVALIDESPAETLTKTVRLLGSFPTVSHFVAASLLSGPLARTHMTMLLERLANGAEHSMLGKSGVGRVALLTRASRREARFERMSEFYSKHGLSARTLSAINDVYEELVTNALYDAPVDAGFFPKAVPRTEDVELPVDRACEISYGMEEGTAFIRIRDTFGALKRSRLLDVLHRCSTGEVELDESRGGAGLGLWRVFSAASTISITVAPGNLTDILVGIATKNGRIAAKQLLGLHLFFFPAHNDESARFTDDDSSLLDRSITLVGSA
ncbi:MAG: hypothetical protein H0T42_00420 [Deltaproteobacteria bacterium]|nr:hypothetical protein [Deltaproteobacteria bacterium]